MLFGDSSFFNLHLKYSSLLNIKVCQFCPKWRLPTFQDARRLADEQRSRKLGGRTVHGHLSQTGLECSGTPFPVYIESISHRFMNQRNNCYKGYYSTVNITWKNVSNISPILLSIMTLLLKALELDFKCKKCSCDTLSTPGPLTLEC